jgi:protein-tyrosine-phosphatase
MKQYNRILFVAENGTCRAPMAAGILGEYVLKHPVEIGARGMIVLFPEPLNQKAEAVMISNGINLEGYMSAQLTEEAVLLLEAYTAFCADFTEDTLVLVMEHAQLEKVLEKYERANPENVYVLTELVGDELEILDPYGGSLQAYGLCYETMRKTIKKLVTLLNEESNEGSGEN